MNYSKNKIFDLISREKLIQKEIYKKTDAFNKSDKRFVRKILKELLNEGKIYKDSRNRYNLIDENLCKGIIEFTKNGNIAFVETQNGEEIAILSENMSQAMHKDEVLVEKIGQWRDLDSGRVIKVLNRKIETVVGEFQKKRMFGFVIPINNKLNKDFYIPPEYVNGAKEGDIVELEIIKYPTTTKNPEGKIINILGKIDDPNIDLPVVLSKHNLPKPGEFKEVVKSELENIPNKVTTTDIKNRKDLRNEIIFTIDGESAKDFDDAISIEKLDNGNYKLGVHIADVSNYVVENSELDKEAFKRSTSVYLINTVIPMLPHELSDWICSLVEGEDRLTLSLDMFIDKKGQVIKSEAYNAVIRSKKRLTYNQVNLILEDKASDELKNELDFLKEKFLIMKELMDIIRNNRKRRGAILDIESGEVYFEFDKKGKVKDIIPIHRGISEKIIEEFMIKANETIASYFDNQDLPFIYRTHDNPDPDTLLQLKNYLSLLGIKMKLPQNTHPKVLQEILEKTKDHELKDNIQKLLVRSMQRAIYSESNIGHFGLASESYTHFTSPIRRYPDLIVHRLLKLYIKHNNSLKEKEISKYKNILPKIADHCSKNERIANEAEWDFRDMKKVEYISNYIGEMFQVIVTGVTKFGLFVEVTDKLINGLIHISDLNDYYIYNERDHSLIGKRNNKMYKLGDKIKAVVLKANKIKTEVDFAIYEEKKELINKKKSKNIKKKNRR